MAVVEPGRVYGGRTEPERRAERRARLLEAGFALFGTEGWSGTSIERICTLAGVATRSFYEEFPQRAALLAAVYTQTMEQALAVATPLLTRGGGTGAVQLGLAALVEHMTEDPRRARIAFREIRLSGVLEDERQAMALRFADLIADRAGLRAPDRRTLSLALTGAVAEVMVDWVSAADPPPTGPIVEALTRLFVAARTPTEA